MENQNIINRILQIMINMKKEINRTLGRKSLDMLIMIDLQQMKTLKLILKVEEGNEIRKEMKIKKMMTKKNPLKRRKKRLKIYSLKQVAKPFNILNDEIKSCE